MWACWRASRWPWRIRAAENPSSSPTSRSWWGASCSAAGATRSPSDSAAINSTTPDSSCCITKVRLSHYSNCVPVAPLLNSIQPFVLSSLLDRGICNRPSLSSGTKRSFIRCWDKLQHRPNKTWREELSLQDPVSQTEKNKSSKIISSSHHKCHRSPVHVNNCIPTIDSDSAAHPPTYPHISPDSMATACCLIGDIAMGIHRFYAQLDLGVSMPTTRREWQELHWSYNTVMHKRFVTQSELFVLNLHKKNAATRSVFYKMLHFSKHCLLSCLQFTLTRKTKSHTPWCVQAFSMLVSHTSAAENQTKKKAAYLF